jgi:hypothetical protein
MPNVKGLRGVAVCLALAAVVILARPVTNFSQEQNFRIMNLERRLDQLQHRLDAMERLQRGQAIASPSPSVSPEALLEVQRQQLAQAEQVVLLQQRVLQLQKMVDQLAAAGSRQEKGEKPAEKNEKPEGEKKPKPPPRRP